MEKEIELEQEAIVVYSGGGAVNSVNGYTGDVVLTTSDLENTSDYQTGAEVESAISTAIAGKQDTLTAGNNITISNNTISATDTTYSAGTGLTLDGTQFSVNTGTIATQQDVSNEATARENADINLQGQIDAISSASDVTDIVGTYAALQAYDTTHLKDNDIIKVLQDESQNDETTYYRWSTSTQTFTLIGEEGPYYTKSQTDTLLQAKQNNLTAGSNITIGSDNTISATDTTYTAGTNVSISSGNVISATDTTYTAGTGLSLNGTQFSADTTVLATQNDLSSKQNTLTAGSNITISDNTISATDTTYSNFTGTDGTAAGAAGLVPAPATTDVGKFLGASGLWENIQAAGIKTLTSSDYNWPVNNPTGIAFWLLDEGQYITDSTVTKIYSDSTSAVNINQPYAILVIMKATANSRGCYLYTTGLESQTKFVTQITTNGMSAKVKTIPTYVIDNLTSDSSVNALSANQGKVLKGLIDSIAIRAAGAPTASTIGSVGTLYEDTTNGDLYICTDAANPYVWEEVGAGGGGSGAIELTSADYNWNSTTNTATEPYDCIAAWLLNDGRYHYDRSSVDIKVFKDESTYLSNSSYYDFTVTSGGNRKTIYAYGNSENLSIRQYVINGQSGYEGNKKSAASLVKDSAIVQSTGTSTTDVMSQNAVTSMVYADPGTERKIRIGNGSTLDAVGAGYAVAIGGNTSINGANGVAIGYNASVQAGATAGVALGNSAQVSAEYSVAFPGGVTAAVSDKGVFQIGLNRTGYTNQGYNNSVYRLLTGLYDPQSDHDAATKGYVDPTTDSSAPTTATVGRLGQIQIDTTTATAYMCVAVDTVTPAYTWKQITA